MSINNIEIQDVDGNIYFPRTDSSIVKHGDSDVSSVLTTITNAISNMDVNLSANDLAARNEIMDLKLKLKEQTAINYLNKTGIGFYDNFADNSNIDLVNTNATYDGTNKEVDFPAIIPYAVKSTGDYNNVNAVNVKFDDISKTVGVGDKVDNTNEILTSVSGTPIVIDKTAISSIVGSAYVTSATARPQVLNNGWIVCVVKVNIYTLNFYISKDNGTTWSLLCYIQNSNTSAEYVSFALTSYGNNVYLLYTYSTTSVGVYHFDATTVSSSTNLWSNLALYNKDFGITETAVGGCSIAVSSTGVLTAAWCSKNATYPNSFNIRSAKSVNGGVTWTKQDGSAGVDQVINSNSTGNDITNPYVIYDKNNSPTITSVYKSTSAYYILVYKWSGTTWESKTIYNSNSTSYTQLMPVATLQKYGTNAGRIWVVWESVDSTDTPKSNIRVSYSDDNGTTWSISVKLTSGSVYAEHRPCVSTDINGNVYVIWDGQTATNPTYTNIRLIKYNGTSWGSITEITSQNINNILYTSMCDNYYNFTNPISIWQDNQNTRVAFYGKWNIPTFDITLTNPITIANGDSINIYPIEKSLKMVDETFDTFNNLDLCLYPKAINKATVSETVNNSNSVVISSSDKTLLAGDKLYINNALNEVTNFVQNYTTYDRTTPVSVVGSAYVTSATARPQVLSNGWIINTVANGSTNIIFYVSKDNGLTWSQLCYMNTSISSYTFAVCSYGTKVYLLWNGVGTYSSISIYYFDATTINNIAINNLSSNVDTSQTSFGSGCSIAVSSTGVLTATWCSKNSTYPNGFNIRSAKSVDGGITWTKQDGSVGIDQLTTSGTSNNNTNPYIIYDKNDKPIIFAIYVSSTTYYLNCLIWNVTNWNGYITIYNGTTHAQYRPIATLQKYGTNAGRIWLSWDGVDSTDTSSLNIRVAYSDDNSATWSTPIKLTSGNVYHQSCSSISADIIGNIYIMWCGITATSGGKYNIRMIKYDGTSWGSITEVTNQSIGDIRYPSTCNNYYNFAMPITIWEDDPNTKVTFYGKWNVEQGYTLTMQNPTTLTDGSKVPIVDLSVQQNGVDLPLESIDSEKFVFKGVNLNTETASIKISGRDNSLNNLVYAIS